MLPLVLDPIMPIEKKNSRAANHKPEKKNSNKKQIGASWELNPGPLACL